MSERWAYIRLIVRVVWTAAWDWFLAASFLIAWVAPYAFGEFTVHKLTFLMLLEFLVVHSTGFFAAISGRTIPTPWWKKSQNVARSEALSRALMFFGLLAFYCLFAASFSLMYGGPWPLIAFLLLALPRLPSIALRPIDDDAQFRAMAGWAAMTALYLAGAFLTILWNVPPLGVTAAVIEHQGFTVGGLWPEEPYRVMAFGALYFFALGILGAIQETVEERAAARKNAQITQIK